MESRRTSMFRARWLPASVRSARTCFLVLAGIAILAVVTYGVSFSTAMDRGDAGVDVGAVGATATVTLVLAPVSAVLALAALVSWRGAVVDDSRGTDTR